MEQKVKSEEELQKEKNVKNGCIILIIFTVLLAFIFQMCSDDNEDKKTDSSLAQYEKSSTTRKENWSYGQQKDEMTENIMYYATCTSTNSHEFEFPYNGGSFLFLILRRINNENKVIIQISKGQIMTSFSNDQFVRFKFDGGDPIEYTFSSSSDGDSKYAFINHSNSLIKRLKSAKEIKIDIPLYKEGRPVFNFDVSNLKWEY